MAFALHWLVIYNFIVLSSVDSQILKVNVAFHLALQTFSAAASASGGTVAEDAAWAREGCDTAQT